MRFCRSIPGVVCLVGCLALSASAVRADTAWTTVGGETVLYVFPEILAERGLSLETKDKVIEGEGLMPVVLNVSPDSTVSFTEIGGRLNGMSGGDLRHIESLTIRAANGRSVTIDEFSYSIDAGVNATMFHPRFVDQDTRKPLLAMSAAKAGLYRAKETFELEGGDLRITPVLAELLGDASLAGVSIGDVRTSATLLWSGGEEPVPYEVLMAEAEAAASPHGGNQGTECPMPIGPDVITGTLIDMGNYGSAEVPVGSGNWIAAFSVGTTSCNLGNQLALWDDDQPPPTNLHPVIAQNIFKLRTMPDGTTRFEQIGQSWLKHSFTVAAGDACGCGCTGPGGPQLHPGCSDPYGSGLNGSQGGLGPRWQVNPRTGEYPHPYQDGTHLPNDGNVWKRLQIKETELAPSSATVSYFAEGIYITQDEQQAGNAANNASYAPITMTSGGIHSWSSSIAGTTVRMRPAIKAWKVAVPSVVETDIVMSPGPGEPFQEAREYLFLAANVKPLGNGLYNYEYALYNLNSHRGVGSFSIPVPESAQLSDVGFHDVDYHSGDGHNGATRSNNDWTWSHSDGLLTFSTPSYDVNPNSNALMWGVLFNFRFTCNIEPASEQGDVVLGLFRPGTPSSTAVSTVVPEPSPLYLNFVGAAPTTLMAACTDTGFDVDILNGSDTFSPGTAKIHYSIDNGEFVESPLTLVSGATHRAQLPAVPCGSTMRFYLSAQSLGGTTVTNPEFAPTSLFAPQIGVEEIQSVITADFDSGLPGGWNKNGLWDVTSSCPVAPGCNGGSWAYFGQPSTCDYATGAVANGSLTKSVTIPSTRLATLYYCSTFEREPFAQADWPTVKVNGVTVDQPALGGLASSPWQERSVNLTQYAGQTVTLEWNFNTGDAFGNDYLGWQIDNVRLDFVAVVCGAPAVVMPGDLDASSVVDGVDVTRFVEALMAHSVMPEDVCPGDFSGNGMVDLADVDGLVSAVLAQP